MAPLKTSELKLRRIVENNVRLREDFERPRVKVSEASARYVSLVFSSIIRLRQRPDRLSLARCSLIRYCRTTRDFLVPSVWGPVQKHEDPYAPQGGGGCCEVQ